MVPQTAVNPLLQPERRSIKRRHVDEQLFQREKELEAARRICDALFQHTDVDRIVEMALRTALEVLGVEVGSILLANPDTKQLVFRHSLGVNPVSRGTSMPWDRGIAGSVFKSGKPEVVADAGRDDRHYSQVDKLTGFESHDMIVFPLKRWEGDPIGVLEVLNKRNGRLEDDALAILSIISAFTAFSIEQARLFQEAKLAEVARLTGDISHDIKNLLMPVVTGADLLEMELSDLCTKLAPWDAKQADASRTTCNDILAMLREDAGRIQDRVKEVADCVKGLSAPPVFAPCRLAEVVGSVLKTLRLMAEEKKIAFHAEGLDALPTIQADARRLYNAFYNLVNNAIPEVPPGGSITVRGQDDPARDAVCVAVADTGRGMPPEIRDSLFSSRAISRKPGGTGLGTKIVKDVVDAHRGQITVESKEGIGTTFLIRLPLSPLDISATKAST